MILPETTTVLTRAKLLTFATLSSWNQFVATRLLETGGVTRPTPTTPSLLPCRMCHVPTSTACAWASMILKEMSLWIRTGSTTRMDPGATFMWRNTAKASRRFLLCKSSCSFFPSAPVLSWLVGHHLFTSPSARVVLAGSQGGELVPMMLK